MSGRIDFSAVFAAESEKLHKFAARTSNNQRVFATDILAKDTFFTDEKFNVSLLILAEYTNVRTHKSYR